MKLALPRKIDSSLISARALFAAEIARLEVLVHVEYTTKAPRLVWERHALVPQNYVEFATGKSYPAVKRWQQRDYLRPVKIIGTAALFSVAHVEHLLQTEDFAASDDDLCEAAWIAQAFWAWVPADGLKAAPGSPAERIASMPFMAGLSRLVNERLEDVAALRRGAQAGISKKAPPF